MDRAMSRRVLPFLTLLCTSSAALATDYELSGTAVLDPNAIATNRIDPNGNVGSSIRTTLSLPAPVTISAGDCLHGEVFFDRPLRMGDGPGGYYQVGSSKPGTTLGGHARQPDQSVDAARQHPSLRIITGTYTGPAQFTRNGGVSHFGLLFSPRADLVPVGATVTINGFDYRFCLTSGGPLVSNTLVIDSFAEIIEVDTAPPDADADGIPDATDNCISTANPDQTDTDLDGQGDACDPDNDNDGVPDATDNCKFSANADQANLDQDALGDVCDADADGDSVLGTADNCPMVPNVDQTDTDHDSKGDDCDTDDDNDTVCDLGTAASGCMAGPDNCPTVHNTNQVDLEGDGIGDACDEDLDGDGVSNEPDNCPIDANVGQDDADGDGQGDVCDTDIDNDTVANAGDNCPHVANADQADQDQDGQGDACDLDLDGDGVATTADNCPTMPNSDQLDFDGDGSGDACDTDVDGDQVANGGDQCGLTPIGTLVDPQNGCSLAQLCPCAGPAGTTTPWKNHGKYVSCVAHVAGDFAAAGLFSQSLKDTAVSAAGQSSCGK